MSMQSAIYTAAALNSDGFSLMESGRMDDAYEYFAQALEILMQAEHKCAVANITWGLMLNSASWKMEEHFLLPLHLQECAQIPTSRKGSFKSSPFYVYDEPLQIVPAEKATLRDVAIYKATLLFNMGFVFHKKSNCVDTWGVYWSLYFYELSLDCCKGFHDHPSCLEVLAAALNNKAHVFFDHSEFLTSRDVLDTLLVTMILVHGRPLEFAKDKVHGILFNLYMLRMPTAAPIA